MEKELMTLVNRVSDLLWTNVLITLLVVLGIYFTFRMRFVQFRMIPEMIRLLFQGTDNGKTACPHFKHSRSVRQHVSVLVTSRVSRQQSHSAVREQSSGCG